MIEIQIKGVAAELTLGNYKSTDTSIFDNWEDFYRYNDLLHVSLSCQINMLFHI